MLQLSRSRAAASGARVKRLAAGCVAIADSFRASYSDKWHSHPIKPASHRQNRFRCSPRALSWQGQSQFAGTTLRNNPERASLSVDLTALHIAVTVETLAGLETTRTLMVAISTQVASRHHPPDGRSDTIHEDRNQRNGTARLHARRGSSVERGRHQWANRRPVATARMDSFPYRF